MFRMNDTILVLRNVDNITDRDDYELEEENTISD